MAAVDRIVVDRAPWATRVAFLASGEVVELWVEGADRPSLLGGIALARVTAVNAGLGTTVVATPAGEALLSDRRSGEGGRLILQIIRDAQAGKRAAARAAIELADGPVLLTPQTAGIGLSSAITGKARRASLRAGLESVVPEDIGVLVRSPGADRPAGELVRAAAALVARWFALQVRARRLEPPAWLEAPPPVIDAARAYAPGVEPELDESGRLFEDCGGGDALEAALARRVPLAGGGELVIDAAEAATLIDVNLPAGGGREGFRRVNAAAAQAALQQLRLRGIRGTVLLDLPRMADRAARAHVEARVAACAADDRTPTRVLGWTPGGMLELVREGARRPLADELLETSAEPSPSARAAAWRALAGLRREAARIARPRLVVAPAVARWLNAAGRFILEAERRRLGHLAVTADPALVGEAFRVESED